MQTVIGIKRMSVTNFKAAVITVQNTVLGIRIVLLRMEYAINLNTLIVGTLKQDLIVEVRQVKQECVLGIKMRVNVNRLPYHQVARN